MPDISMCVTRGCPLEKKCYRKQATPNTVVQSYMHFNYKENEDEPKKICQHFIPTKRKRKRK